MSGSAFKVQQLEKLVQEGLKAGKSVIRSSGATCKFGNLLGVPATSRLVIICIYIYTHRDVCRVFIIIFPGNPFLVGFPPANQPENRRHFGRSLTKDSPM